MDTAAQFLPWLVPLCPLVGFFINALIGRSLTRELPAPAAGEAVHEQTDAHAGDASTHAAAPDNSRSLPGFIATLAAAASFVLALLLFLQVIGLSGEEKRIFSTRFDWMQSADIAGFAGLDLGFRLVVDPLTALMLLIITGIGTLIHLYSIGYMAHERGYARYFAYLNLFVFFMLLLVMGSNLLVLFVGWEGVGLASYLLIGFSYQRKAASDAGKKAFIVNRVGDCALLIALFLVYQHFGTFELYGAKGILSAQTLGSIGSAGYGGSFLELATSDWVPLLMLIGATGKSAQIPLYVWLPDAMEGPTPVSALIHAATMVTAGVYLLCRMHALFLLSPITMSIVAVIGLTTAVLAAIIAVTQNDIKRVLAYSTVSQLGYMFLACGVGAFGTAMFHVTTHAFFKALLFLGAGSVIHAMGGEQDMRRMGGLGKKIPVTFATMFIGTLAIAGVPPLAGFWSKDEILLNAFAGAGANGLGHWSLWLTGFIVSGLTAFYMMRLMMKTFFGAPRYNDDVASHLHKSPPTMTLPLVVLAFLSIFGGLLNAPLLNIHAFENFLGGTVEWRGQTLPLSVGGGTENFLLAGSGLLAIIVCIATFAAFRDKKSGSLYTDAQLSRGILRRTVDYKDGINSAYNDIFDVDGGRFSRWLGRTFDRRFVDGIANGVGGSVRGIASGIKNLQSGYVRNYALSMLVGVIVVVLGCLAGISGLLH